jgi:thioredoxin reductase
VMNTQEGSAVSDGAVTGSVRVVSACCAPAAQVSCCAPPAKAACCGSDGPTEHGCGCAEGQSPSETLDQAEDDGDLAAAAAHETIDTAAQVSPTGVLPVVVIGAGPVGLAAAAHLLERGLEPLVLEAGDRAGAAVAQWGHVSLFSPWASTIDAAAGRLLDQAGWTPPDPNTLPTGRDLVERYLAPLAATPELASRIRTGSRVIAISRLGVDKTRTIGRDRRPYVVRVLTADGTTDIAAAAVIDASGTWGRPNPLGAAGLPADGEAEAAPWLAGPLPDVLGRDRQRFAGRRVLVVGMGHSAANTLLALARLQRQEPATRVTWAIRAANPSRLYGAGDDDQLPARGALGGGVRAAVRTGMITLLPETTISRLHPDEDGALRVGLTSRGESAVLPVDVVVGATGFRPDLEMLRELRLHLDPALEAPAELAPLIDPNVHTCGTVPPHGAALLSHPDEDFYLVGMKSYGRAPTFLLATGYEQVRSIAAAIAGDKDAADRVELQLPETGACHAKVPAESEHTEPVAGFGFGTGALHDDAGDLLATAGTR